MVDNMEKLKFYLAMTAGKLSAVALRILGRNATYMPGVIALKICKNFIKYLQKPAHLICVTGTNGKTTTSNFITSVLKAAGHSVTNNSFGSNVQAGVAAALLLNSTFTGKHKNEYAVIEVDERSSLLVYPFMAPDYLICNNIMRDSMKRNAHTEFISYVINSAVPETATIVLNADDIICSALAPQCKNRVYFGVEAQKPAFAPKAAADIVYCPKCGALLQADYLRYNHIGRWHCTACDFGSPARDFTVTDIDRAGGTFTVMHADKAKTYRLVNDNITNVFNFCGAIALLTTLGIDDGKIAAGFENAEIVSTRYNETAAGDLHITRILAKGQNPVAVSGVFRYIAGRPEQNKCLLLIIDDKEDNINNSETTCWLYDLDYEPLKSPDISCMIFAGKRGHDHMLRAAMTGIDTSKIILTEQIKNSSDLVDTETYKNIFILYDNYFLDEAIEEEKRLLERGEKRL